MANIKGTNVVLEGGFPTFRYNNKKYHINENEPTHLTCDTDKRAHYFFSKEEVQNRSEGGWVTKITWKNPPPDSETAKFVSDNYDDIVTVKEEGQIPVN